MRPYLKILPAVVILPLFSACSMGPQGFGFGHHGAKQAHQTNYSQPHQAAGYGYEQSRDVTSQYGAVKTQGNLICSDAGCAPRETYSVSNKPTANYGSQHPSAHAYGTQVGQYGHSPKMRGAYGKPHQGYFYGNLGGVVYDTGSDLYGVQGRLGYQSKSSWGAELEGSLGIDDDQVNDPVNNLVQTNDVDYSVAAFALARLPLTKRISAHARAGYHATEVSVAVDDGTTVTESKNSLDGFAYGAGVEYAVSPKDSLRFDFTRYENDNNVGVSDSLSLGYARKF